MLEFLYRLFIFAYLEFWGAYVIIVLLTISLYVALVISHKNIYDAEAILKNNNQVYLWLYRAFVNNGLAYYATWVTIATFLNFSIALTYRSGGGYHSQFFTVILSCLKREFIVNVILQTFQTVQRP
jgi:tryptophan-rich sensory protein